MADITHLLREAGLLDVAEAVGEGMFRLRWGSATILCVTSGEGIAAVGTFGYVGFLTGPPLIGLAAEWLTLPVALGLVVAALAWIAWEAPRVRAAPASSADEPQRHIA